MAESIIEEVGEGEAARQLGQYGFKMSGGDEPIYCVSHLPYDEHKEELLEVVTNKSDIDRARILEYA